MHHHSTGWPRAIRSFGCAAAALLCLPAASATAATAPVVGASLQANALEAPAGAITDPVGRTWVSDHVGGFCRLSTATPAALDADTCLGGALALIPTPGPAAAGQPSSQDPTPNAVGSGDEVAYVPDEAAGTNTVDVLLWNPASRLFSLKSTITMSGVGFRPTGTSLGPDGNLYVAFKQSPDGDIQRVIDPASDNPVVEVVGHSDGSPSVAAGYDAKGALTVYTIGAGGIEQLHPNAAPQPPATASPFDVGVIGNPPLPRELGALFYDVPAHVLYAGSADAALLGAGIDVVDRFDTDTGAAQLNLLTGLTTVSGLGVDANGGLLVGNVPAADAGISEL